MNGNEFYSFLKNELKIDTIVSNKNNKFIKWVKDQDLQFSIPNNYPKSIPKKIIITSKDCHNLGLKISNKWLVENNCNRGWCLPIVLNYLFHLADQKSQNSHL